MCAGTPDRCKWCPHHRDAAACIAERRRRERKAPAFKDGSDSEGGKRVAKRKKTGNVSITEGNAHGDKKASANAVSTTTFSRPRRSAAAYTNHYSAAAYTNDYSEQLKGGDSEDDEDDDAPIISTFDDDDDEYLDDKKPPAARKSKMGKVFLKGDRKKPAANKSPATKPTGMCVNLYPLVPSKMNTISCIILLSSNIRY